MNVLMKKAVLAISVLMMTLFLVVPVNSHCEIPCGIYGDQMRIKMMSEHIQTIEKSINTIIELGKENDINYNQLVRWVANKDDHADKISDIVTQYFMKQRVNPKKENAEGYEKYVNQITLLHKMIYYSMKCKQTTDIENVEILRENLRKFNSAYFEKQENSKTHVHDEHHGHSH